MSESKDFQIDCGALIEYARPALESLAAKLQGCRRSWFARLTCDGCSDAVYWTNEFPYLKLRAILNYRSNRICGLPPNPECERVVGPVWRELQKLAPNWAGFHPSRWQPTAELAAYYKVAADKFMTSVLELGNEL